jgi:hypothetical protein
VELIKANRASAILYLFLTTRNKPGDHYLLPTNICPEVVLVFLKAGIRLTFLDLETENLGLEPNEIQNVLEREKVNGILYNHTYGNEYVPIQFLEYIKKELPDIYLIDDRCLCFPNQNYSNGLFDLVLFSTGPRKQIDIGYGGYGFLKGEDLNRQNITRSIKDFEYVRTLSKELPEIEKWKEAASLNWLEVKQFDLNGSYFDELFGAETKQVLHKKVLKEIYYKNIPQEFLMDKKYNDWRVQIRVKNKKRLLEMIFNAGMFAGDHYRSLGTWLDKRNFPVGERLEKEVVNLFIDLNIGQEEALQLSSLIKKYGNPVQ